MPGNLAAHLGPLSEPGDDEDMPGDVRTAERPRRRDRRRREVGEVRVAGAVEEKRAPHAGREGGQQVGRRDREPVEEGHEAEDNASGERAEARQVGDAIAGGDD